MKINPRIITNNKMSNVVFLGAYAFLLEIFIAIIKRKPLPFYKIFMLSGRLSGKSHQVEHLIALLMLQSKASVVCNYVRARNKNTNDGQENIYSMLMRFNGGNNVMSNKSNNTLRHLQNKTNFTTLNEEKEKVQKTGGKIGLSIEYEADYIITFYEECSQLNGELVENHLHSVRGNPNTKYLFIFASNPWLKDNWFVKKFNAVLPESKNNEYELLNKGYNMFFDRQKKELYFRPRYTLNNFVSEEQIRDIEDLKNYNYNKWRIVSLGFSGNLNGSIYEASLQKLNQNVKTISLTKEFVGGVDWGDGKSAGGSPSVALIGGVSYEDGIDLYGEMIHQNNKGVVLNTQQQQELICNFYINFYKQVQKKITVYVDNAATGDFYNMFNVILQRLGYTANEIEFLPAFKPKNTWERVETVNNLMCLGILRYNAKKCPRLYESMENCYEVVKANPTENQKRERSHEWTHALHALEYLIGTYMKEFQLQIPELMRESKALNDYAIY